MVPENTVPKSVRENSESKSLAESLRESLNILEYALSWFSADHIVGVPQSQIVKRQEESARSIIAMLSCEGHLEPRLKRAYDLMGGATPPDLNNPLLRLRGDLVRIVGFAALVPKVGFDKKLAKCHHEIVQNATAYLLEARDWIAVDAAAGSGGTKASSSAFGRFAVTLSFPGEKRDYVKAVDECLTKSLPKESVFYDNRFKAELARPNLDTHLQDIYSNAELVVVFLCADYQRKPWCGLEWRAIRAMIGKKLDAKIMLFRFDNAKVDGLFDIDGYIDAGTHPPEEAVKLILQRLGSNRRQARGSRKRKPQRH